MTAPRLCQACGLEPTRRGPLCRACETAKARADRAHARSLVIAAEQATAPAGERWRPIPDCDGRFEISDFGRVRRLKTIRAGGYAGEIVGCHTDPHGYVILQTLIGRRLFKVRVHRLVLEAFVGPCPPDHEGAHGDGNSGNNALSNLSWATPTENSGHKYDHGTVLFGERNQNAKLTASDVRAIRAASDPTPVLAERFGVHRNHVNAIRARRAWAHLEDSPCS